MADTKNLLSPEELDALATGIEDGSIQTNTGLNGQLKVERHDLTSEDSSLGMNLGVLNIINERFVRHLKTGIVDVLRTEAKVSADKVMVMPYREYVATLQAPTAVNIVNLNPLRGSSLAIIDPAIIFSVLDNFFGGPGADMKDLLPTRTFTKTELSINKIITNILFGSLQEAWAPVMSIKCVSNDVVSNPDAIKIADKDELVIVSRFTTELGQSAKGNIEVVYLYSTLKPIRDSLESRVQASAEAPGSKMSWTADLMAAAMDAEVDIRVILGNIESTFKEFENLTEGDILFFKKPNYAKVHAGGIAVFEGDIGTRDAHMAVQFVNPLIPS
jgi:flagellar motor switch protein FliM|tara:strand:+ start:69 stop:1058 length:990 start_codon:yes stop_codon:yes gene_type:complete